MFFREMLRGYKPGDRVSDVDALDLFSLLGRHPEYVQKVGTGVSHFTIIMTEHGTPCFRIERVDGSGTDFSFMVCIRQQAPSRKQEVSRAFRWAVRYDMYNARDHFFAEHKDSAGTVSCAETGERITLEQAHMDHRPPMTFEVIVTTFLAHQGLDFASVPISWGRDDQTTPELTHDGLRDKFRAYHATVARLDFVKKAANLAQSARERLKPYRIYLSEDRD